MGPPHSFSSLAFPILQSIVIFTAFFFYLLADRPMQRPFCPVRRGKEEGGGVCAAVGACTRKQPTWIRSNTHIDIDGKCTADIGLGDWKSHWSYFCYFGEWIWTWEDDQIPHKSSRIISKFNCVCVGVGVGAEREFCLVAKWLSKLGNWVCVTAEVRPGSWLSTGLRSAILHSSAPKLGRSDFTLAQNVSELISKGVYVFHMERVRLKGFTERDKREKNAETTNNYDPNNCLVIATHPLACSLFVLYLQCSYCIYMFDVCICFSPLLGFPPPHFLSSSFGLPSISRRFPHLSPVLLKVSSC